MSIEERSFGKELAPCPLIVLFGVAQISSHLEMWETAVLVFCSLLVGRLILLKWKEQNTSNIQSLD